MNKTTDGPKELESHWEHSVHQALCHRNRILGAIAAVSVLGSTLWVCWWAASPGKRGEPDTPLVQDWSTDINQATAAQLQLIPGLGPKLVSAILAHREKLGGFQSLDQLAEIPGIKQQRIETLSRYLKVSAGSSTSVPNSAVAPHETSSSDPQQE